MGVYPTGGEGDQSLEFRLFCFGPGPMAQDIDSDEEDEHDGGTEEEPAHGDANYLAGGEP